MSRKEYVRAVPALAVALAVLMMSAQAVPAQTSLSGRATALQATVSTLLGSTTTALADTGSLVDDADARGASLLTGSISGVGGAEVLEATTISSIDGYQAGDYVASAASLADVVLDVAGNSIRVAFAAAEADAPVGAVGTGWSTVEGLSVNGVPIALTGTVGETISLPGVTIVANEVLSSASGVTANALHIIALGVDVVVASATAGVR